MANVATTPAAPTTPPASPGRQAPDAPGKPAAAGAAAVPPEAVDGAGAGAMFGLSEREWRGQHERWKVPAPVRVGRHVRWLVSDLRLWAARGCPPREKFEQIKKALQK